MPSAFTGELRLASLDADCRVWRLEEPLRYEVGALGSGRMIEVPTGFITDGASIPPPLRGLLPPWGRYSRAAIVHDYLLRQMKAPRRWADGVFYEAMLAAGVARPLAWLMWAGVRIGAAMPLLANWADASGQSGRGSEG